MITKFRKDDYYVINRVNLKTRKKERVKSKIKKKSLAKAEMKKLADKLGAVLIDGLFISHKNWYYGIEVSNDKFEKKGVI